MHWTLAQDKAITAIYNRDTSVAPTLKSFRKQVQGPFGFDNVVGIDWKGMWLGIETDGYTHS